MPLEIACDGPCAGHHCDQCRTCRSGHCCRRDNPNYTLPEMGSWEGATYGDLGVLVDDGARVECHCCGKWFRTLARHIWHAHDLTTHEYRALFGLGKRRGLCSAAVSAAQAEVQRKRMPEVMAKLAIARDALAARTPEQIYADRHQPLRLETRKAVSQGRGGIKTNICQTCGGSFSGYWVKRRRACSPECLEALLTCEGRRKLTANKAREIRDAYAAGEASKSLAARYGVTPSMIVQVVRGRAWVGTEEQITESAA